MNDILDWLDSHESVISALVGIAVLIGIAIGPLGTVFRRSTSSRVEKPGHSGNNDFQTKEKSGTSIAILPVNHAKHDTRDDAWALGLYEDLMTFMARSTFLEVVSINEASQSHEAQMDNCLQQGARYAIQTNIRPLGDKIRVNLTLLDVHSGHHLWSELYHRPIADVESAADDLAHMISTQILIPILEAEVARTLESGVDTLDSSTLTRLGYHAFLFGGHDAQTFRKTRKLLDRAVDVGPQDPKALAMRAISTATMTAFGFSGDPDADRKLAFQDAETALRLAPSDAMVLNSMGWVSAFFEGHRKGLHFLEKAVAIDPTNAHLRADFGHMLAVSGDTEGGRKHIEEAFRLSPQDPRQYIWHHYLGTMAFKENLFEEANEHFDITISFAAYSPSYILKITVLVILSRIDQARETMQELAARFKGEYTKQTYLKHIVRLSAQNKKYEAQLIALADEWPE